MSCFWTQHSVRINVYHSTLCNICNSRSVVKPSLQPLLPHAVGGDHQTVDIQSFITTLPCQLSRGSFLCNTNWLESHPLTTSWDQSWMDTYRALNRLADVSCKRHPLIVQTVRLYLTASFTCVLFSSHSSNSDQFQYLVLHKDKQLNEADSCSSK
jgi:hypothetical protein